MPTIPIRRSSPQARLSASLILALLLASPALAQTQSQRYECSANRFSREFDYSGPGFRDTLLETVSIDPSTGLLSFGGGVAMRDRATIDPMSGLFVDVGEGEAHDAGWKVTVMGIRVYRVSSVPNNEGVPLETISQCPSLTFQPLNQQTIGAYPGCTATPPAPGQTTNFFAVHTSGPSQMAVRFVGGLHVPDSSGKLRSPAGLFEQSIFEIGFTQLCPNAPIASLISAGDQLYGVELAVESSNPDVDASRIGRDLSALLFEKNDRATPSMDVVFRASDPVVRGDKTTFRLHFTFNNNLCFSTTTNTTVPCPPGYVRPTSFITRWD